MAVAPPFVLDASPVPPAMRRYSIFDAAIGPLDLPGNRLVGVDYESPNCVAPTATDVECDSPGELVADTGTSLVHGTEFQATAELTCLAPGSQYTRLRSQVLARLEAGEHVSVEEFVASLLAAAPGLVDLGNVTDVAAAYSALEDFLYADSRYGIKGIIHAAFNTASRQGDARELVKSGSQWTTHPGTVVYWNAGLPENTLYITGQVVLWNAKGEDWPWVNDEASALNRTTNEWSLFAQRPWAAGFECFAARVTVTEA